MIQFYGFSGSKMKKMLAAISMLCLLLVFVPMTVNASGVAAISATSTTVEKGGSASVSVNLSNNPGIWGLKLKISYDSSVLTLQSVSEGGVFTSGETTVSENLSKNPYAVVVTGQELKNKTENGGIVVLDFVVNSNGAEGSYPISVEVTQAINVDGETISTSVQNGSVTVQSCQHGETEWKVTAAASCKAAGTEILSCKKCGAQLDTREVAVTDHKNTEVRAAAAATESKEGYTGDIYCKDCSALIEKGTTIAKLENIETSQPASTTNKPTDKVEENEEKEEAEDTEETVAIEEAEDTEETVATEEAEHTEETGNTEEAEDTEETGNTEEAEDTEETESTETELTEGDEREENKSILGKMIAVTGLVILFGGAVGVGLFFSVKRRRF